MKEIGDWERTTNHFSKLRFQIMDRDKMYPTVSIKEKRSPKRYVVDIDAGWGGREYKAYSFSKAKKLAKKYMKAVPHGADTLKEHRKALKKAGIPDKPVADNPKNKSGKAFNGFFHGMIDGW